MVMHDAVMQSVFRGYGSDADACTVAMCAITSSKVLALQNCLKDVQLWADVAVVCAEHTHVMT